MKQPGNLRRALKSGALYTLLLAALLVVIGVWGAGQVQRQVDDAQLAFLEGAIRRSAVQCYALEGRYPDDLAYLETRYGLTLDRDHYVFHYENQGGNLLPQIAVFSRTQG